MSDPLPGYLLGKYQMISTVMFAAFFSMAFILLCLPFSHNVWFELGPAPSFAYTVAFFLLALTGVILSRRGMYRLRNEGHWKVLHYVLWCCAEVFVISLLYAFFTLEGDAMGLFSLQKMGFGRIFLSAAVYTAICLGVPYLVAAQYFAIQDRDNTIRLLNMSNVVSDMPVSAQEERRITLFDNNGTLKLSVNSDNLYFIESEDNYIHVWYMDSTGAMKQYMLRCRLKTVEDSFADSVLVRCHRKYIVNMDKVSILTYEKDGYYLDLDIDSVSPIPVSKTYEQTVLAHFNSR